MSLPFKKYINSIRPYEPGKPIDEVKRELGLKEVIKVASNENPIGISPRVRKSIIENMDTFFRYPDGGCWQLKQKLASYHGVDKDEIVIGNGSNEIIEFIAKGFIESGDNVLSSQYAFLVYPLLTKVCDGDYIESPAKDFGFDLDTLSKQITKNTKVIFLSNPNNPTGTYFNKAEFEKFIERVQSNVIICLDEAYFDFVTAKDFPNGLDYFKKGNIVVLRTFSKAFGLAGFRIGYGIASRDLITYFNKIRQPFNVNALAQCAACAVLDDSEYVDESKRIVDEGKKYLYEELSKMGLYFLKSETNFILINVKKDSRDVFQSCLRRGVVIRDMKAYKLDTFIRITVGLPHENRKIIAVLKDVI